MNESAKWVKEVCGDYVEDWCCEQIGESLDRKDDLIKQYEIKLNEATIFGEHMVLEWKHAEATIEKMPCYTAWMMGRDKKLPGCECPICILSKEDNDEQLTGE